MLSYSSQENRPCSLLLPKKQPQDWGSHCHSVIRAAVSSNVHCCPSPQGVTTALKGTGGLVTSMPRWKRAHVRTLNKEGQLCPEGSTGGCESRQSLQEQGPPRPQLLFSPKEHQPQPHEQALTAIRRCFQTGGGCLQGSAWCCQAAGWHGRSRPAAGKCSQLAVETSGESLCLFFS